MTKIELRHQIDKATRLVDAWPAWKQNILIYSSRPSVSSPRPPVNNQTGHGSSGSRESQNS